MFHIQCVPRGNNTKKRLDERADFWAREEPGESAHWGLLPCDVWSVEEGRGRPDAVISRKGGRDQRVSASCSSGSVGQRRHRGACVIGDSIYTRQHMSAVRKSGVRVPSVRDRNAMVRGKVRSGRQEKGRGKKRKRCDRVKKGRREGGGEERGMIHYGTKTRGFSFPDAQGGRTRDAGRSWQSTTERG